MLTGFVLKVLNGVSSENIDHKIAVMYKCVNLFTYWLYCTWIVELLNDPEVAKRILHMEDHKECFRLTDGISEVEWSNSVCHVIRKGNFAKVW